MKIGVFNNLYEPYSRGGAEKIAALIVRELADLNHQVFTVSTCPQKSHQVDQNHYLKSAYYTLNNWPIIFRWFWQLSNLFNIHKYYQIKKIIAEQKPEIIITNNLMGLGLLIPRLLKNKGVKQIHILHDIQLLHPSGLIYFGQEKKITSLGARIYQFLTKKLFASPQLIVSPSAWLLNLHTQNNFFTKSEKIIKPNPQPTKTSINPNLNEKIDTDKKFNLLYVGQIETHKGILLLLQAFNELNNPLLNLIIVGDGSKLKAIKKMTADNQQIKFLGRQNETEILDLMASSQALIVPSLCYENSPTVIYEAAANNLPTIAANLGGIPELINKFGGLLFAPNNPQDLKDKITYLINNYSETKNKLIKPNYSDYIKEILK